MQVMEKRLKTIWKIYKVAQVAFGQVQSENRFWKKVQGVSSKLLRFSIFFGAANFIWAFFASSDILMKIYFANCINIASSGSLLLVVYMIFHQQYAILLNWCESLQERFGELAIFKKCGNSSTKIFTFMTVVVTGGIFVFVCIQWVVLSLVAGRIVSPVFTKLPFQSNPVMFVYGFYQAIAVVAMMLICGLVMGLIFVCLLHFMAALKYLREFSKSFTSLNDETLKENVQQFVELHTEILKIQEDLGHFAFAPSLILEGMTYGLFFFVWVVVFFIHHMAFLAVCASGAAIPYLMFFWVHEKFLDEHESLRQSLHNVEWYKMTPKQRKMLLPLLVLVDHPKLLKTGPFHVISYEELGKFLNRVYSCGLFFNKIVKKF